jgi:hypothetical protein
MVRSGGAWLTAVPAWRRVGNLETLYATPVDAFALTRLEWLDWSCDADWLFANVQRLAPRRMRFVGQVTEGKLYWYRIPRGDVAVLALVGPDLVVMDYCAHASWAREQYHLWTIEPGSDSGSDRFEPRLVLRRTPSGSVIVSRFVGGDWFKHVALQPDLIP